MKIPLTDQLTEAERQRDELTPQSSDQTRLHRAEAIVLSLRFLQAYEQQFREFMRQRSTNHQEA